MGVAGGDDLGRPSMRYRRTDQCMETSRWASMLSVIFRCCASRLHRLDQIKAKFNEAEEFARKIWLAGLGAYGKSIDEAQGRYEQLSTETQKMFEELVVKGEALEEDAKGKFKQTTSEVEERVADVRKKLGLDADNSDQKIEELSTKIDALTEAVAKLAAAK